MAAGEGRIPPVLEIVAHPLQAKLRRSAQRVPKARELSRFGYLPPSDLHPDTLPSVTNHSEREHRKQTKSPQFKKYDNGKCISSLLDGSRGGQRPMAAGSFYC